MPGSFHTLTFFVDFAVRLDVNTAFSLPLPLSPAQLSAECCQPLLWSLGLGSELNVVAQCTSSPAWAQIAVLGVGVSAAFEIPGSRSELGRRGLAALRSGEFFHSALHFYGFHCVPGAW